MSSTVSKRTSIMVAAVVVVIAATLYLWLRPGDQREVVMVTPEIVEQLVADRKSLYGGEVSDDVRDALVVDWVNAEILRRAAKEHGIFVEGVNSHIRNSVIDQIVAESGERIEPSSDDIIAYYSAHKDRYRKFDAGQLMVDSIADRRESKWEELRSRYRIEYADGVRIPEEPVVDIRRVP